MLPEPGSDSSEPCPTAWIAPAVAADRVDLLLPMQGERASLMAILRVGFAVEDRADAVIDDLSDESSCFEMTIVQRPRG